MLTMKNLFIKSFLILSFFFLEMHCFASAGEPTVTTPADSLDSSFMESVGNERKELIQPQDYTFSPQKVIIPTAVFAAGVTGTYLLDEFKNLVRDNLSWHKYGSKTKVDEYLQYSTIAGYVGIGFIPGVRSRCVFKERLMAGVTAYAVMAVAVNAMKYSFRHPRPDQTRRNSFPSGHSATVFTGAELMRIEYGSYIGMAGYAVGIVVGALRIYNDRHWITDVIGGAAIGILSARVGYWLLPYERKLFGLDRKKNSNPSFALLPMIGETNGLSFSLSL